MPFAGAAPLGVTSAAATVVFFGSREPTVALAAAVPLAPADASVTTAVVLFGVAATVAFVEVALVVVAKAVVLTAVEFLPHAASAEGMRQPQHQRTRAMKANV